MKPFRPKRRFFSHMIDFRSKETGLESPKSPTQTYCLKKYEQNRVEVDCSHKDDPFRLKRGFVFSFFFPPKANFVRVASPWQLPKLPTRPQVSETPPCFLLLPSYLTEMLRALFPRTVLEKLPLHRSISPLRIKDVVFLAIFRLFYPLLKQNKKTSVRPVRIGREPAFVAPHKYSPLGWKRMGWRHVTREPIKDTLFIWFKRGKKPISSYHARAQVRELIVYLTTGHENHSIYSLILFFFFNLVFWRGILATLNSNFMIMHNCI